MKLLFKGPVLITGGSSQLGMALARALREEGAETLSVCRSSEGLARCGEAGLCSLPLGEPESLPERCRGLTMLARRFGRCVFVSSSAAECPAEGQGYYAAAKLAGEALYRSLAVELSGRGITACSLRQSCLYAGRCAVFLERR